MEEELDSLSPAVGLTPGGTLLAGISRDLGLALKGELDSFLIFRGGSLSSPTELRNYTRVRGTIILHGQKRPQALSDHSPLLST